MGSMILAIFLWRFATSQWFFVGFLVHRYLQDQVQHFNARAEEYHRRHGDETSPFQACLLGTAQRDETIIKNAVGGEYCGSTTSCVFSCENAKGRCDCNELIRSIWSTFTSIYSDINCLISIKGQTCTNADRRMLSICQRQGIVMGSQFFNPKIHDKVKIVANIDSCAWWKLKDL